jgi:hypothetical protein
MSNTKSEAKIENWLKNIENGYLKSKQTIILDFIINNPNTTIHDIRTKCGISHQTTTSAVSIMLDEGVVRFNGTIKLRKQDDAEDEGDTYSMLLFVSDREERKAVKKKRIYEKFVAWAKQGVSHYKDFISPQFFFELGKKAHAEETTVIEGDLSSLLK